MKNGKIIFFYIQSKIPSLILKLCYSGVLSLNLESIHPQDHFNLNEQYKILFF